MSQKMELGTICFVGGGQMAEALIKGLMKKEVFSPKDIVCSEPMEKRRKYLEKEYGISTFSNNKDAIKEAQIVLLAVKPQVMDKVLDDIRPGVKKSHLVISIAAGVTLERLEKRLGKSVKVIRVMPNTPALVLEGAAGISRGKNAGNEDMKKALHIFSAVGKAVEVDESLMDAVTGLSGSGPAYCFQFIEALISAGIREGLPRQTAATLAIQTVIGSARMCMETGRHPMELLSMVTSPGGTTIQGLYKMERSGFSGIVMDAVNAATARSRELGKG